MFLFSITVSKHNNFDLGALFRGKSAVMLIVKNVSFEEKLQMSENSTIGNW